MRKLSEDWKSSIRDKLDRSSKIDITTQHNLSAKWLICELSKRELAFKVINLGAGVKRVTTDTEVCPKCNGTGRC